MEPAVTWYDVLGVLSGAEAGKIKREYDAKAALLRPELIAGASPTVVKAVSHVTTVLLTEHPMAVDGLVADQDPRPPARARRGGS
jgi:hypothetical protein